MPKVLLIDDEKDFTELTGTLLDFHEIEVDMINDPRLVEERLKDRHYDLIVTDLMMPNLNGFQLIDKIRKSEAYKNTPVLVLTAKPLTDEERKFLFQHNASFMTKPFEPLGLVEQIQDLVKAK